MIRLKPEFIEYVKNEYSYITEKTSKLPFKKRKYIQKMYKWLVESKQIDV